MANFTNNSENGMPIIPSDEEIEQVNKEATEAFWARFPELKPRDVSLKNGDEQYDFANFEKSSREADEILFRLIQEEREKEKKKEIKNIAVSEPVPIVPGFKELEDAQKKVNDIYVQLYLTENSAQLGKNVTHIMNDEEISPDASNVDEVMDLLCQKYLEYVKEQGVPEDILNLMSSQKFTLTQMMEIKFGWEDGLSGQQVSKYANPEFASRKMVLCRYHLLCEKEKDIVQVVENNNKKDVQQKKKSSSQKTEVSEKVNVKGQKNNSENKTEPGPKSQVVENNKEKDVQERKEPVLLCSYKYEYNDGDQIWDDHTEFFKDNNKIKRIYTEGFFGKTSESYVTEAEMLIEMNVAKQKAEKAKGQRGGHSITKELPYDLNKKSVSEEKTGIDEKISNAAKKKEEQTSKKKAPNKTKDTSDKAERGN